MKDETEVGGICSRPVEVEDTKWTLELESCVIYDESKRLSAVNDICDWSELNDEDDCGIGECVNVLFTKMGKQDDTGGIGEDGKPCVIIPIMSLLAS